MRKYESLIRYGKSGTNKIFESGKEIIVEEKLDGANASMQLVDGEVLAFSRNHQLDAHNNLRGFWQYAQGFADKLQEGFIYYGEWLVPHTIQYPKEALNTFYLFDIFDIKQDRYLTSEEMTRISMKAAIQLVPALLITDEEPLNLEDVMKVVGKSGIAEVGEGVVVKYWNNPDSREAIKIVSDAFKESKGLPKQKVSGASDSLQEFISATVTPQRIEKLLNKLVDEDVIPEDYDFEHMGIILKGLGSSVYDDVMKEESDVLEKIIKKKLGKIVPVIVKEVISKR